MKEIIFALPPSTENTAELYDYYKKSNCKIKIYDYPPFQTAGKKRQLREFEIEDLLFRKPIEISDEKTLGYYANKVVLITGGGSIGSELCRQLAKMSPKQIIILDIYENGVYDVNLDTGAKLLGDIVISMEKAMEQAELYNHPLQREIGFLTVHSMLHLLGYDHENGGIEAVHMREKEETVLTQIGWKRDNSYYMGDEE